MLAMDVWCFSKSTARIDLEKHQTRLHYWRISLCNFGESPLQFWVFLLYTKQLLAEASFIKYAFYNYSSIMQCSEQRIATLQNIQEAKKVAMKDIEFYMMDLDSLAHPADGFKVAYVTERAFQIKESLDFSIQLYGFACVLEAYYAQNYDPTFLQYVDKELSSYIVKCEKRILGAFSLINGQIINYKGNLFEKVEKEPYEKRVKDLIESMHMEEDSSLYTTIHNAIQSLTKPKTYYIKNNGDIYVKSVAV